VDEDEAEDEGTMARTKGRWRRDDGEGSMAKGRWRSDMVRTFEPLGADSEDEGDEGGRHFRTL